MRLRHELVVEVCLRNSQSPTGLTYRDAGLDLYEQSLAGRPLLLKRTLS